MSLRKNAEVWKRKDDEAKYGIGGTCFALEERRGGTAFLCGPCISEDGNHRHLMGVTIDEPEFDAEWERIA